MTPISHAATGLAAGGLLAPLVRKVFKTPYRAQFVLAFIASLFPDIDAASLLFSHSIYYGKDWYSHHMAAHSFAGAAIVSTVFACLYLSVAVSVRGVSNLFRRDKVFLEHRFRRWCGAWIVFFAVYCTHFLGDLVTPPGPWGGIALYWPNPKMAGGWNRIYWHNWYLIYIAVLFLLFYPLVHLAAGLVSSIKYRYFRYAGRIAQAFGVIVCALFLFRNVDFIMKNDLGKMGFPKWDALNRSLVPPKYMKLGDKYMDDATSPWRKKFFTQADMIKKGNQVLKWFDTRHAWLAPRIARIMPEPPGPEQDMRLYRKLQAMYPGMEDREQGEYRVWVIREIYPNPDYYNRGFLLYYIRNVDKYVIQMSNASMMVFRIEERDRNRNALRVSRVYHSNKIFVPVNDAPQLNLHWLKYATLNFWRFHAIPHNLIPMAAYSVWNNLVHGFFPSINSVAGYMWPGIQTGYAIHDGIYSSGCTVACYLHLDWGANLQNPYYPVWQSADRIIDINQVGSRWRGSARIWGKGLYIRDLRSPGISVGVR